MAILAAGQRRYLFEKELIYLFSYDVALREHGRMEVQGGRTVSLSASDGVGGDETPPQEEEPFTPRLVYHVMDDNRIEDNDAITGSITWLRTSLYVPDAERTGSIEGTIGITTGDQAVLDSCYKGSFSMGSLGAGHFDSILSKDQVTRIKAFISPHFETPYPKYKWLGERQCAGFGLIEMKDGLVTRATFDIYAMR